MKLRYLLAPAAFVLAAPAFATTKGLNQIVTPDIQPAGQVSFSYQMQDPNIANSSEFQVEVGLTKRFEIAVFQGLNPGVQIANAEFGLIQKMPYLLSTGFINWSTRGSQPQPYLEGGYYKDNVELMAGVMRVSVETSDVSGAIRSSHETQGILGVGYRVHPRLLVQADYQSGVGNFSSAGFTYNITPALQFNPALYISNDRSHKHYGYVVLTWNVTAWN